MEKKKPPSDAIAPPATAVPHESSMLFMNEILNQFRLINAHFDQIGVSIKNGEASMVNDKVSTSTQDIDVRLCQRMC